MAASLSRRMRRLAIVVAVGFVAGCGGDDKLSVEEYRSQATSTCSQARRALDTVKPPTRTTNAAIANYFERLLLVNRETLKRFTALEPPDELAATHKEALAANREGVDEVARLVAELERGGDARDLLQSAQGRLGDISVRSARAARRLGVPECARQG